MHVQQALVLQSLKEHDTLCMLWTGLDYHCSTLAHFCAEQLQPCESDCIASALGSTLSFVYRKSYPQGGLRLRHHIVWLKCCTLTASSLTGAHRMLKAPHGCKLLSVSICDTPLSATDSESLQATGLGSKPSDMSCNDGTTACKTV